MHIQSGIFNQANKSNHIGPRNEGVPAPCNPRHVASYAHHDGDGLLHCPGGRGHHVSLE